MELLPFDEYVASLNRKRNSAGALMYAPDGRVLLVEPSYKPNLDLPGGAVEADEPPWRAVSREVSEELGLVRRISVPLVIDYVSGDDRLPEGLAWIFDGGPITEAQVAALELTDPEVTAVALFTLAEAEQRTKPGLIARISAALDQIGTGKVALCEDGQRVA